MVDGEQRSYTGLFSSSYDLTGSVNGGNKANVRGAYSEIQGSLMRCPIKL
jgi:hypothetical protein